MSGAGRWARHKLLGWPRRRHADLALGEQKEHSFKENALVVEISTPFNPGISRRDCYPGGQRNIQNCKAHYLVARISGGFASLRRNKLAHNVTAITHADVAIYEFATLDNRQIWTRRCAGEL